MSTTSKKGGRSGYCPVFGVRACITVHWLAFYENALLHFEARVFGSVVIFQSHYTSPPQHWPSSESLRECWTFQFRSNLFNSLITQQIFGQLFSKFPSCCPKKGGISWEPYFMSLVKKYDKNCWCPRTLILWLTLIRQHASFQYHKPLQSAYLMLIMQSHVWLVMGKICNTWERT